MKNHIIYELVTVSFYYVKSGDFVVRNVYYFPDDIDLKYLQLKIEGKKRKEIIEIMGLHSLYYENKLRKYILNRMGCKNIKQAVIIAYILHWIELPK